MESMEPSRRGCPDRNTTHTLQIPPPTSFCHTHHLALPSLRVKASKHIRGKWRDKRGSSYETEIWPNDPLHPISGIQGLGQKGRSVFSLSFYFSSLKKKMCYESSLEINHQVIIITIVLVLRAIEVVEINQENNLVQQRSFGRMLVC